MKIEVFEKLLTLNKGFDQVIGDLKVLESAEGLGKSSIELYAREAEQLRLSVNRYLAQMIEKNATEVEAAIAPLPPEEDE